MEDFRDEISPLGMPLDLIAKQLVKSVVLVGLGASAVMALSYFCLPKGCVEDSRGYVERSNIQTTGAPFSTRSRYISYSEP